MSYYGTCGVTQLPISYGEDVVLILLTHDPEDIPGTGYCGSNGVWAPAFLPISGEYDDAGFIEGYPEDWNLNFIMRLIRKGLKQPDLSFEDFHDLIHKEKAVVKAHRVNHFGYMLVRRAVYDALTEKTYIDGEPFPDVSCHELIIEGKHLYEFIVAKFAAAKNESERIDVMWAPTRGYDFAFRADHWNSLFGGAGQTPSRYSMFGCNRYSELLTELAEKNMSVDDPTVMQIITELAKLFVFDRNLEGLRKGYAPQAGAGSQSEWTSTNACSGSRHKR